jgi:hypothetical protein
MRTTLELPDEVFREVKLAATGRGVTLKFYLRQAIEHELKREDAPDAGARLTFPLIRSKKPGALKLTNEQIDDLLT